MEDATHPDRWHSTAAGVTVVGLATNLVLAAAKLAAGALCHSQIIVADGLHSLSDLATDIAVLAGLRISGRPADEDHHYGHRRAMTLVTALLGAALLAAGVYVAYGAIHSFHDHAPPVRPGWPLAAAIASVALKEALYRVTARVGRRTGDSSIVANAWHHRSDAISSVAAAAGLTAVAIGGDRWQIADGAAALLLASFLIVVATRIIRDAAGELMDRAPSADQTARIERAVAATDGVASFHAFRARRLGGRIEMDIHVQVDPDLSVRRGHEIAATVKRSVMAACPDVATVIVHVEPVED